MIRETFPVGLFGCNCTILGDESSREAIVVDPGFEIPKILSVLAKHELTVKQIVITHAHFDHVASAGELKAITGAPIVYSKDDLPLAAMLGQQPRWLGLTGPEFELDDEAAKPDHSPETGEALGVRGVEAQVILTPGHTEGSLCLYVPAEGLLLAGDTLFAGGVGRTDLPGGSHGQLIASVRERLLPLPAATVVVPGHGGETTIGREAATNPFLR